MILGQDATALTIFPLGMMLGENAYHLLNELNVYLLILTILIIKEFFDARSQGQDEGSPAVLALKRVELHMVSFVAVFILFWSPSKNDDVIQFKAYKCHQTSFMKGHENMTTIANSQGGNLPFGWALLNNISVGFTETLSSQLPCDDGLDTIKSNVSTALIEVDNKNLVYNLQQHYKQCYLPAQTRIAESKAQDKLVLLEPYNIKDNYFFGNNTLSAYDGMISSDGKLSELRQNIREDYWNFVKDPDFQTVDEDNGETVLSIACGDAAAILKTNLSSYVDKHYSEEINRLHKINQSFEQDAEHSLPNRYDAVNIYTQQAYIDQATGKAQMLNPEVETTKSEEEGFFNRLWTSTVQTAASASPLMNMLDYFGLLPEGSVIDGTLERSYSRSIEILTYFGVQAERLTQASTIASVNMFLPVLVAVILAIVYAATPILLVLSGYSWRMIKAMCILIFTLHFSYYIMNMAQTFESTITAMATSELGQYMSNLSTNGSALNLIASYSFTVAIFVWIAMCLIVGLQLGTLLNALFDVSGSSGNTGAKAAIAVAKEAAKKSVSK